MENTKRKIKQLEIDKHNKVNSIKDNLYKYVLYAITGFIALIILYALIYVLITGIKGSMDSDLGFWQLMFGSKFTPSQGIISMGFIIGNTIWMAFLAALLASPVSIGTAIIITRVLSKKASSFMYSIVAILAAIPSVVYGAFGYYVLDNMSTELLNFDPASLFTMIIMLSFMITPTITIMTVASIKLTDRKLEDSSYALGASKTQTSLYITLRSAKVGIYTGILFAVGRCLGESTAISMVGTPSTFLDGLTLPIWKQSLFLAPALLSSTMGEIHGPFPMMPIIALFLLMTTMLVFGCMKFYEFNKSDDQLIRKQSTQIFKTKQANKKLDKFGIEALNFSEQKTLIKSLKNHQHQKRIHESYKRPEIAAQVILRKSTLSPTRTYETFKKTKTKQHNAFIYLTSLIGVGLLLGILFFLFRGGFEYLTWDTLTSRQYVNGNNKLYGLAVPMMGTLLTVITSLAIALPIGVTLGMCLSTYLDKSKKTGWFASFIFQAITSVPTIIWSTIAIVIFAGTSFHQNYIGFEPIIFLSVVIMPTIIKTTEEAGGRVRKDLIEGSYSLGATKLTTTLHIYLREAMPSIIAGSLLAISIAMAETTVFISILPFGKTPIDIDQWISNGGFTLATTIYHLKQADVTLYPETLAEIKTIGIVLMMFILVISLTSILFTRREYMSGFCMLAAIVMVPFGFYINEGSILILSLSLIIAIIGVIIIPMTRKIMLGIQRQ
ncbi:MAG: ABC transporter permease subunit [Mycoplasmataceae bacterium]|nr:ABC transporter permease subunit [Mycoplasmataceae bacterium]